MNELQSLCDIAMQAARVGGEIVAAHFGAARNIEEKAPGDWVSAADIASEAAVKQCLADLAPHVDFFGEESGGVKSDLGWFVDPLDGTANFLHGLDAVGVSIGLVRDGKPVVGVVHAPLLYGRMYHAYQGGGAFKDGTAIHVSTRSVAHAIPATGFPFRAKHRVPMYLKAFEAAFGAFEDMRRIGGASLDLSWSAEGVFDGYFELGLGTWDVAAGAVLVREAGGVVTDWAGDPDEFLWSGDIVAGNPAVHAKILEIVKNAAN